MIPPEGLAMMRALVLTILGCITFLVTVGGLILVGGLMTGLSFYLAHRWGIL